MTEPVEDMKPEPLTRRLRLRNAAMNKSIGPLMSAIEATLDEYCDQGREPFLEGADVAKIALYTLIERWYGDKVVLVDSSTMKLIGHKDLTNSGRFVIYDDDAPPGDSKDSDGGLVLRANEESPAE